jgi:SAM-dependent methyltransferase
MVYAAARVGLADLLAAGPRMVEDLARSTGTHARSLHRLLRALASQGILTEVEPRRFALTSLGAALRSDAPGAARATVMTLGGDWQWKAWDHFLYSLQTGRPAMAEAHGMGVFEYLAAHPEDSARFNEAMVGLYAGVGSAVAAAYDFSRFRTVVDLGGGTGSLLIDILRANRGARGVLFELPEVIPQARRTIEAANLSARCQAIEGDFFTAVPGGHDAYILSHALHDWTDEQALAILRNCRDAIASDGRLLIVEAVLPPGDTPHHGKLIDLVMLTITGGAERTAEEFASLLAAANFSLLKVHPTTTHQSIVEAVPV